MPKPEELTNEQEDKSVSINDESQIPDELSKQMDEIMNRSDDQQLSTEDNKSDENEDTQEESTDSTEQKVESDIEDKTEQNVDSDTSDAEAEEEQIDPRLVEAARKRGWSDDKIVEMAETMPEVLEDLADMSDLIVEKVSRQEPQKEQPQQKSEPEAEHIKFSEKDLDDLSSHDGEVVGKVIQPMMNKINSLMDTINGMQKNMSDIHNRDAARNVRSNMTVADEMFDVASEKIPSLGKTKDIAIGSDGSYEHSEMVTERSKVFEMAKTLNQTGMQWRESMQNALAWYKGKQGEDVLYTKFVSDVNKQKKRFSPRPTNKRTVLNKKYASEDERIEDEMTDIYEKVGIKIS